MNTSAAGDSRASGVRSRRPPALKHVLTNTRYVTSGSGFVLWAGAPRRIAVELGYLF
jgi:hypothetical protein